jgi:hypothetical protein
LLQLGQVVEIYVLEEVGRAGAGTQTAALVLVDIHYKILIQQKNITDQLGQSGGNMGTRMALSGWNSNSWFRIWWITVAGNFNATEEYNGSTWTGGGNLWNS